MLQDVLDAIPDLDPEVAETAVLLTSELAENAVLHAGTEFEVGLEVADVDSGAALTVSVTDRGSGPLEAHLSEPRHRYGRAASHGRGLGLVARLATAWGTRHDADGRHTVWFALASTPAVPPPAPAAPPDRAPRHVSHEQARRLLHIPAGLVDRLQPLELVEELVRRLRDVLDVHAVAVVVDEGDGGGAAEVARAGPEGGAVVLDVALPVTPPLRGSVRLLGPPSDRDGGGDLVELVAYRVAMAVETRWLRAVDQRRRSWMAYLAEASELLGQSLSVELAVAVVPQVVVPRLGRWCAVHLVDAGTLRLAALTHADEDELPELRAALDPQARPGPSRELRALLDQAARAEAAPVRIAAPTDGLAVPLRSRGATIGALLVGRPEGRPHAPEDVVLITDIARRAALAVQNAQSAAAHVAVSQALQQALLPRALPTAPGLDLAAEYLPASRGSDVGGDFYDVMTVDSATFLVSIGDVCGKGARAAARTGLVRDVLRVLVRDGHGLTDAVRMLNEVMIEAADPLQFCTLAAALVRRSTADEPPGLAVELLLAGHERPLLVRADGLAEQVGAFGTAVGLLPRMLVEATNYRLAPDDTLLLYTDGVTERRRGREQFGPERLLALAARTAGRSAREVVAAVRDAVERFSPSPATDDVALLAVRALPE
jgi:serine phosphatase RsbU (regulator of sigma subunit)/anti-sigma regulatory factor (Ser/Thr protein kinase)